MKIHRSLIDPNSVFIENDDDSAAQHIEPLPVPGLSSSATRPGTPPLATEPASYRNIESVLNRPGIACVGDQVVHNVPAANGVVQPLLLPTMNFDPPGRKKTAAPATRQAPAVNGVEPLPLPTLDFKAA